MSNTSTTEYQLKFAMSRMHEIDSRGLNCEKHLFELQKQVAPLSNRPGEIRMFCQTCECWFPLPMNGTDWVKEWGLLTK